MKQKTYKTLIIAIILALSSFTILQFKQEKELIVGTWNYIDEVNNKWIFTKDQCLWQYDNETIDTFTYHITEETATNGVVFSYLKLVNISDSSDVYDYEINALNENNLALDYLGDLNEKLMLFEKQ